MDDHISSISRRPSSHEPLEPSAPMGGAHLVWLAGAVAALAGAGAPWFHETLPLFGTVTWTGVYVAGPLLPLLLVSAAVLGLVDVAGHGGRSSRAMAAGAAAVAAMVSLYVCAVDLPMATTWGVPAVLDAGGPVCLLGSIAAAGAAAMVALGANR